MMFRRRHTHIHQENERSDQKEKIAELRGQLGALSEYDLKFCTDACLIRYLKARNWNTNKSKKMLEETLKWRSTYKPENIHWHEVAHEGETGKASRANFCDRFGRTVLILRPAMQNTTCGENNIRHFVYLLENAIFNLEDGQEQMSWLVDFTGWSVTTNVSIKTSREIANILQSHYPERLAMAFLYDPPRIFQAFWKAVKYFLDAKTFEKVKFIYANNKESVEMMRAFFDFENLPKEFGGQATMKYDHEEFSRIMISDEARIASLWGS